MTTHPTAGSHSPWGAIQRATPIGPDACHVSTSSHGGVWVTPAALARIPAPYRSTAHSGRGWFEEDCDWCIPYLALGLHRHEGDPARGERMLVAAREAFANWHKGDPATLEAGA